jgi:hypothetical protein
LPSSTPEAREPGVTMPSTDKAKARTSSASASRPAAQRRGGFASVSAATAITTSSTSVAEARCVPRTNASVAGAPSIGGTIAAATGRSALRQAGQSKQAGRGCASRSQALAVVTTSINSTQAQARRRSSVRRESAVVTMSAFEGRRASS